MSKDFKVKILATGMAVPEKILTNFDLEKIVDTTDEWIRKRTGMVQRHIADENTAASDLAYEAAKNALQYANMEPKELDMIVISTVTSDYSFPSTACLLQEKLGCRDIPAFDVSAGCTGFIYGITIAKQFIETGYYNNILVIGVEILTKITNWKDRGTCVLFGDGAGAAILTRATKSDSSFIIDTYLGANGKVAELLIRKGGGSRNPISKKVIEQDMPFLEMEGNKIFRLAVKAMGDSAEIILKKNNLTGNDLDWLIPHQANLRIIYATAHRIKLPKEKVIINIQKYGNTSSASIPIALDEAIREGKIKRGDLVMLDAFGAGLTWGSVLFRY